MQKSKAMFQHSCTYYVKKAGLHGLCFPRQEGTGKLHKCTYRCLNTQSWHDYSLCRHTERFLFIYFICICPHPLFTTFILTPSLKQHFSTHIVIPVIQLLRISQLGQMTELEQTVQIPCHHGCLGLGFFLGHLFFPTKEQANLVSGRKGEFLALNEWALTIHTIGETHKADKGQGCAHIHVLAFLFEIHSAFFLGVKENNTGLPFFLLYFIHVAHLQLCFT